MKVNRHAIKSESDLVKTLDMMFDKSKENKSFFGLIELMKNEQTIITAIHNIKSNKGSKTFGVDDKDINYYLQMNRDELIKTIHKAIDRYKPLPVRRLYIPKSNGKMRPLGIPTMLDRIIQELARMALEPIVEAKFYNHSYGFRRFRSAEHALARTRDVIRRSKAYYVIEGDIESFFDNINHNKLIEMLWKIGIKDKRYLSIIKKMLKAGYVESSKVEKTDMGTPQGGIISPLLANIYLNNFDWMVAKEYEYHPFTSKFKERRMGYVSLKNRGHAPTYLVRYADDWVIVTTSLENATIILKKVGKYLNHKLKLNLSKEKTLITDIRQTPVRFLGYCIKAGIPRKGNEVTGLLYPDMKKLTPKIKEIKKEIARLRHSPNLEWTALNIERINSMIVGISNYINKGISKRTMEKIDNRLFWTSANSMKWIIGASKIRDVFEEKYFGPMGTFDNRKYRHEKYTDKNFFVTINGLRIGLTKAQITPVKYARNFNQNITPFSLEGRRLWAQMMSKQTALERPTVYHAEKLVHYLESKRGIYNFEFHMNRDYAFNRDRGKCRICGYLLFAGQAHCHHIETKLPMDKINKVPNLVTICERCHIFIHGSYEIEGNSKMAKLARKLRTNITRL